MARKNISYTRSFEGYSFAEAIYRNKDALKAIIAIIAGANYITGLDVNVFITSLGAAVITFAAKLLIDAIDFWLGEIEI